MRLLFIIIPGLAWRLSDSSLFRALVIGGQLYYFALTRKLFKIKADYKLDVSYNSHPITFFLRYVMDIAVLREVFIDSEYDWSPNSNPAVIIDLGAHFGDTALYYHARWPQAKIIAVEPSPENYARLVKHVQNIPNIIPVEAAVGATDGEIELNIGGVQFGHSVLKRDESQEKVIVPQLSLPTLFNKYGVTKADLIKFDIEGAEFSIFNHLDPKTFSPAYIGEVHLDMSEGSSLGDFKKSFVGYNLNTIELSAHKRYILTADQL